MAFAIAHARGLVGLDAPPVRVEVHLAGGLPKTTIVGLPAAGVRESKDRVRSALLSAGYRYPDGRITVNLAPADLPKDGSRFDLAIALGILAASGQVPIPALDGLEFVGELGLDASIRSVHGVIPTVLASERSARTCIVPLDNAREAAYARPAASFAADHLLQVTAYCAGSTAQLEKIEFIATPESAYGRDSSQLPSIDDVRGQTVAKRAIEIALAGRHNLLLCGPPGTGKTMLATRMHALAPNLTFDQAVESASIASFAGFEIDPAHWLTAPFRQPHHTISAVGLIGGGNPPAPGEISLAHNGILFLDELAEFGRYALDALRQPMEAKFVQITRARAQAEFPANFQLVAAMNPCPCGYFADRMRPCRCSAQSITRYQQRISGPLLDRIEMHITVSRELDDLAVAAPHDGHWTLPTHEGIAARVEKARTRYRERAEQDGHGHRATLTRAAARALDDAKRHLGISERVADALVRVGQTIADLTELESVTEDQIIEALSYRSTSLEAEGSH